MASRSSPVKSDYHPGNLTTDHGGLEHDDAPPMSDRTVVPSVRPILYDAQERPIYRKVGFHASTV